MRERERAVGGELTTTVVQVRHYLLYREVFIAALGVDVIPEEL